VVTPTSAKRSSFKCSAYNELATGSLDSVSADDQSYSRSVPKLEIQFGRGVSLKMTPELSFEGGGEVAFNYSNQQVGLLVNGQAHRNS